MRSLTTVLILFTVLIGSLGVEAQNLKWAKRYNGALDSFDQANALVQDSSGNVYVTGFVNSIGNDDCITIKYNSAGVSQWAQRYNGSANSHDQGMHIALDSSNNVYVAGITNNGANNDIIMLKYNSSGTLLWTKRYNGTGNGADVARGLVVDASNNIYVTGEVFNGVNNDILLLKSNSSGTTLWAQRYNGSSNGADIPRRVKVDSAGNICIVRSTEIPTGYDVLTLKYNSSGTLLWAKRYNGSGNSDDEGIDLAIDSTDNIYSVGTTWNGANVDIILLKYNSLGTVLWAKRYNGSANGTDGPTGMVVDSGGNIYITGSTNSTTVDFITLKYNSSGTLLWAQRYDSTFHNTDNASGIAVDSANNVYVTGQASNGGTTDIIVLKYNTAGTVQWVQRYASAGNTIDVAFAIVADNSGNAYIAGRGVGTSDDLLTLKYGP